MNHFRNFTIVTGDSLGNTQFWDGRTGTLVQVCHTKSTVNTVQLQSVHGHFGEDCVVKQSSPKWSTCPVGTISIVSLGANVVPCEVSAESKHHV